MDVFYKAAPEVKADDLSGHVVIIGGIGWNDVIRRLIDLSRLPVRQEEDPAVATGEIFLTEVDGGQRKILAAVVCPRRASLWRTLACSSGCPIR